MTWNGRKLMSYAKDGTSITYKYDGNGLRTSKTVNGVKHDYYYDENNQLIYEIKEGVYELYYKYDADGNLFSITRYRYSDGAKHVYYAVTNTRGDVIELRGSSGAIYATYTYDSWGKCIAVTNANGEACSVNTLAVQNSIRYRGYVYDYETGLYYLQSRYYDPEVGRFLNADDVNYIGYSGEQLSYNAFAYCENNAVVRQDISGLSWQYVISRFFTLMALAEHIDIILTDYIKLKNVEIESCKYSKKLIKCDVEYTTNNNARGVDKKRKLTIKIGDREMWDSYLDLKFGLNSTNFETFGGIFLDGIDILNSSHASTKESKLEALAPLLIGFIGSVFAIINKYTVLDDEQILFSRVWGNGGFDPHNDYLYFLFHISGADDEYERFNGYHAYSVINQKGVDL